MRAETTAEMAPGIGDGVGAGMRVGGIHVKFDVSGSGDDIVPAKGNLAAVTFAASNCGRAVVRKRASMRSMMRVRLYVRYMLQKTTHFFPYFPSISSLL